MPISKLKTPLILAIDTSCDETSAAVTKGTIILSNIVASQVELHKQYGGVFPTVAKQAHLQNIDSVINLALKTANRYLKNNLNPKKKSLEVADLDAIAVTTGPGLAPALEIGIEKAKNLAEKYHQPLIAINHIEAHALSVLAKKNSQNKNQTSQNKQVSINQSNFPALAIIISGGHSQFILIKKIGDYRVLGTTIDDAAGECLDKVGRMLNLGYPAGSIIEKFAKKGDQNRFKFPLPMTTIKTFDLSFSGIKTFSRNLIEELQDKDGELKNEKKSFKAKKYRQLDKQTIYDLCASLQSGVFRHINYKLTKLLEEIQVKEIWLGGGVAANIALRQSIRHTIKSFNLKLRLPYNKKLCGDNAAMIGVVANFKFLRKKFVKNPDILERKPRFKIDDRTNIDAN